MEGALTSSIKITAVHRSLADAIGLAQRGDFDRVSPSDDALRDMAAEMKVLRKKITILYVGTALAAFLIIAQGASNNIAVELFWIKVPLSMLSKQALAVFTAAAFGYYASALVSFILLYATAAAILVRAAPEGWQYLLARYDADMLWMNLLFPKKLGYPSAVGERRLAVIVQISNAAVIVSHILLVTGAIVSALLAAWSTKSLFGVVLALLALVAIAGAIIGCICAMFVRFEYKLPA